MNKCSTLEKGARVALLPHLDAWMKGDRYGVVAYVGKKRVHILMDVSNRVLKLAPTSFEPL